MKKIDFTPTRVMLGLRSSPRKRLQLSETGETASMSPPEKMRKVISPNIQSFSDIFSFPKQVLKKFLTNCLCCCMLIFFSDIGTK